MEDKITEMWVKAKKVGVRGDRSLIAHVGNNLQFMYNGVLINLPLDGQVHMFPDFVAKVLEDKIAQIGDATSKKVRMDTM